jgi:hypothetical protein
VNTEDRIGYELKYQEHTLVGPVESLDQLVDSYKYLYDTQEIVCVRLEAIQMKMQPAEEVINKLAIKTISTPKECKQSRVFKSRATG